MFIAPARRSSVFPRFLEPLRRSEPLRGFSRLIELGRSDYRDRLVITPDRDEIQAERIGATRWRARPNLGLRSVSVVRTLAVAGVVLEPWSVPSAFSTRSAVPWAASWPEYSIASSAHSERGRGEDLWSMTIEPASVSSRRSIHPRTIWPFSWCICTGCSRSVRSGVNRASSNARRRLAHSKRTCDGDIDAAHGALQERGVVETVSAVRGAELATSDEDVLVWSDLHLGHGNIIDYQDRPFLDREDMDEAALEGVEPGRAAPPVRGYRKVRINGADQVLR